MVVVYGLWQSFVGIQELNKERFEDTCGIKEPTWSGLDYKEVLEDLRLKNLLSFIQSWSIQLLDIRIVWVNDPDFSFSENSY